MPAPPSGDLGPGAAATPIQWPRAGWRRAQVVRAGECEAAPRAQHWGLRGKGVPTENRERGAGGALGPGMGRVLLLRAQLSPPLQEVRVRRALGFCDFREKPGCADETSAVAFAGFL